MANVSWDNIGSIPTTQNNSDTKQNKFFKLINDGDKAHVRFLVNSVNELEVHTTHRVHVKSSFGNEWDKTVECLRTDGGQPVSACPFCEHGLQVKGEIFIQFFVERVYDRMTNQWSDSKTLQIWTRATGFADQLRSIFKTIETFGQGKPATSFVIEIERKGAKGSKDTKYILSPVGSDNTTLETLARDYNVGPVDVHSTGFLRQVTWNEAQEWAKTGNLPAPEKTNVDTYGRPLESQPAPAPQAAYHAPNQGFQPIPQYGQPAPAPQAAPTPYAAPQPAPQAAPAPQPVSQPAPQPAPQAPVAQPQAQPTYNGQPVETDENGVVTSPIGGRRGRHSRF